MFSVLTQSHVTGSRRLGIAAAGAAAVHGILILAAVTYTVPLVIAKEHMAATDLRYVQPPVPQPAPPVAAPGAPVRPAADQFSFTIPELGFRREVLVPTQGPVSIPVDLAGLRVASGSGLGAEPVGAGAGAGSGVATGDAVDVAAVDRVPRLIGRAPVPEYPAALRRAGERGRVLLQFVIDTMGRAEMESVVAREATHEAFVEAVRAVLPRYRFSPGEAGGRRVRNLVAIPFEFTLER